MSEAWRSVQGFEGLYSVSDEGRVRSEPRRVANPGCFGGYRNLPARILKQNKRKDGYLGVELYRDGSGLPRLVSNLVALAFIGPRPVGMQTCHNDGIKTNNRAGNLRYDTPSGNQLDRHLHGTMRQKHGEESPNARLTAADVKAIRADRRVQRVIAEEYGVCQAHVSCIKRGLAWVSL